MAAAATHAATVGYYRFEEGTPDGWATAEESILDSMGILHGSPTGMPTYRADVPVAFVPQTGAANQLCLQFAGTHTYRMYLNGQPQTEVVDTPRLPNDTVWTISGRGGEQFWGYLDEVRLSDAALEPADFLNATGQQPPVDFCDDFSGGVNPNLWAPIGNDPLYSITDTDGEIRFSRPAGGDYKFNYVGLAFEREVLGDFDVSVEFRDASIDRLDGAPGNQVQLNVVIGEQAFCVVRSDESSYGHNAHLWRDPPGQWALPPVLTADTSGLLRLTRAGSTVTAYFNGTVLHSGVYGAGPVINLSITLQNNGTRDATSVVFDNFCLKADRLLPKPVRLQVMGLAGNQLQLRLLNPTPRAWHWIEYAPALPATGGWTLRDRLTGGLFPIDWADTLPDGASAGFYRVRTE